MIYNNIKHDIINCKACPLYQGLDYGNTPQWGMGSHVARIMILSLRTTKEAHLIEKTIETKYILLLKKILECAKIAESEIFITNLLKCHCETTPAKKFKSSVNTCSKLWIDKELEAFPTIKHIICFGDKTFELFLGLNLKKTLPTSIEYKNIPVLHTYSFEEIFRKGESYINHAIDTMKEIYNVKK